MLDIQSPAYLLGFGLWAKTFMGKNHQTTDCSSSRLLR
ncbi:hypothetical protein F652_3455 [Enterobacteriaceae bacterium bta3-1]|nr:hypothetical protein F652_3455 [Enterobacteriaceae bacterium bta3-1]